MTFTTRTILVVVGVIVRRLGLRRGGAVAIVVVTAVAAVAVALIVTPLADAVRGFADDLPRLVRELRASPIGRWFDDSSGGALSGESAPQVTRGVVSAASGVVGVATSTVGWVFSVLAGAFMTIFLLLDFPRIKSAADGLLIPAGSEPWLRLTDGVSHTAPPPGDRRLATRAVHWPMRARLAPMTLAGMHSPPVEQLDTAT